MMLSRTTYHAPNTAGGPRAPGKFSLTLQPLHLSAATSAGKLCGQRTGGGQGGMGIFEPPQCLDLIRRCAPNASAAWSSSS